MKNNSDLSQTYMAMMQLVDKINSAVEQNKTTLRVYLDLSKTFDTITIIFCFTS